MPRLARKHIKKPNQVYSVVTRVNNSEFVFDSNDVCWLFLNHLRKVKKKLKFELYGFVIMFTHIHMLIKPKDKENGDISAIMKCVNGGFAQKYNSKTKKKGHFWMSRYSAKVVSDTSHLAYSLKYFAENPIRAGLVKDPLKYPFSSISVLFGFKESFADLIDELPEEFEDLVKEMINKIRDENGVSVSITKENGRLRKRFSFNLRKTKCDQIFKYLVGDRKFCLENKVN